VETNFLEKYIFRSSSLILDNWTEDKQAKEGSCPVVTPSGKHRGCLVFKYDFGHGTIRGAPKKVDRLHHSAPYID
jgi:hypothetical protein